MNDSASPLTSALEQLRLKLLDLTGRNRLINFKHTAGKSLQFVEGHPAAIYQKLVEANNKANINVLGLPEPARRDWVERNGRLQRPEPRDWARSVGVSTGYDISGAGEESDESNVRALMYPDDLAKHCRKIEREATLAIEETGANMLFLVLGFLEFPDQRDSDKTFTAPLISVPVSLQKKEVAGIQQFSLQYTGDDISENLSLREKLRNDFGLVLPELGEEQIDVNGYFAEIQAIIKKPPGFALKHRVSLCLLSFSNMLLVRDLDPTKWPSNGDENSLIDHPIVREVFEGKADDGGAGLSLAEEHLVEEGPGASIPLVYDADCSQHSALIDVLSLKKNLVIDGRKRVTIQLIANSRFVTLLGGFVGHFRWPHLAFDCLRPNACRQDIPSVARLRLIAVTRFCNMEVGYRPQAAMHTWLLTAVPSTLAMA